MPEVPSPSPVLQVEPQRLTAVRQAVADGLNELGYHLTQLRSAGYIQAPWLGDPVSANVRAHYNVAVMESPNGAYEAMVNYQKELMRIHDHLAEMEKAYLAGEQANTDLMRQA